MINLLAADQRPIADRGGERGEARFAEARWTLLETGASVNFGQVGGAS